MTKIIAPELISLCQIELSQYVEVHFSEHKLTDGETYTVHDISIKKSDNQKWEEFRGLDISPFNLDLVLFKAAKEANIVVFKPDGDTRSNDQIIRDNCFRAVNNYIEAKRRVYRETNHIKY